MQGLTTFRLGHLLETTSVLSRISLHEPVRLNPTEAVSLKRGQYLAEKVMVTNFLVDTIYLTPLIR